MISRCICPAGWGGAHCAEHLDISIPELSGTGFISFPTLQNAYSDLHLSLEFKPTAWTGLLYFIHKKINSFSFVGAFKPLKYCILCCPFDTHCSSEHEWCNYTKQNRFLESFQFSHPLNQVKGLRYLIFLIRITVANWGNWGYDRRLFSSGLEGRIYWTQVGFINSISGVRTDWKNKIFISQMNLTQISI